MKEEGRMVKRVMETGRRAVSSKTITAAANEPSSVQTKNLSEVAVLMLAKCHLASAVRENGRVLFTFTGSDAPRVLASHRNGEMTVVSRDLINAINAARDIAFGSTGVGGERGSRCVSRDHGAGGCAGEYDGGVGADPVGSGDDKGGARREELAREGMESTQEL